MAQLPTSSNVLYGTVQGQFVLDIIDGPDPDSVPDVITASGTVSFVASVGKLNNVTRTPNPVTVLRSTITGVLDSQGYLCTPLPGTSTPGERGVALIATDDPDNVPVDWTWTVSYDLYDPNGTQLEEPNSHVMALPADSEVWLSAFIPNEHAAAIGVPQAEALAAAAHASALAAQNAAAAAAAFAEDAAESLHDLAENLDQHFVRLDQVVIGLDTDGVPYFGANIPFKDAVALHTDADGVPYLML
jgi:hypothetical protein